MLSRRLSRLFKPKSFELSWQKVLSAAITSASKGYGPKAVAQAATNAANAHTGTDKGPPQELRMSVQVHLAAEAAPRTLGTDEIM